MMSMESHAPSPPTFRRPVEQPFFPMRGRVDQAEEEEGYWDAENRSVEMHPNLPCCCRQTALLIFVDLAFQE